MIENSEPALKQRLNHKSKRVTLCLVLLLVSVTSGITALVTWINAPQSKVTSILLKEKPAVTSSLTGLQLGERLAEGGVSDLYLILEYAGTLSTKKHRTEVIEVAALGNGVLFDVPNDLINLEQLRRITVYDEDFFSDDLYDSIDVTLPPPYVGSVYQFEVQHTQPYGNLLIGLLITSASAFTLSALFFLRNMAR